MARKWWNLGSNKDLLVLKLSLAIAERWEPAQMRTLSPVSSRSPAVTPEWMSKLLNAIFINTHVESRIYKPGCFMTAETFVCFIHHCVLSSSTGTMDVAFQHAWMDDFLWMTGHSKLCREIWQHWVRGRSCSWPAWVSFSFTEMPQLPHQKASSSESRDHRDSSFVDCCGDNMS